MHWASSPKSLKFIPFLLSVDGVWPVLLLLAAVGKVAYLTMAARSCWTPLWTNGLPK